MSPQTQFTSPPTPIAPADGRQGLLTGLGRALAVTGLLLMVAIHTAIGVPVAIRTASVSQFRPGVPVDFSLTLTGDSGSYALVAAEVLPSDWQVLEFSAGGGYDAVNRLVKFGPFTNSTSVTVCYRALPPLSSTTAVAFNGAFSVDGTNFTVGGLQALSLAPAATAPSFLTQPQSQTVPAGSTVTFAPSMAGTPPFTYQWLKNGTNLTAATNAALILVGVQAADAADYSLIVNGSGSVTSSIAALVVTAGGGGGLGGTGPAFSTNGYVITTIAGTPGVVGSANGTNSSAQFNNPHMLAVDVGGNIFVADADNHVIRKITPSGVVSVYAGSVGSAGTTDGVGTAARFERPVGLACDRFGVLYVTEYTGNRLRKIGTNAAVTTVATGFDRPVGVAVDTLGNVYVGGNNSQTVLKIATGIGTVTVLAGSPGVAGEVNGTGTAARFNQPQGVAVDTEGNVYVTDSCNHLIRKITAAGVVSTLAGQSGATNAIVDGLGSAARFLLPIGIAADGAGNLFVADVNGATLRKITPAGLVTTIAGGGTNSAHLDGTGSAARFVRPYGVATDMSDNLYISDINHQVIRKGVPAGVAPINQGLVAYYPFNGDILDWSGNNRHAKATNMTPAFEQGVLGLALKFPGSNYNRLELPIWVPSKRSFTIAGRIKFTNTTELGPWPFQGARLLTLFQAGTGVAGSGENGGAVDGFGLSAKTLDSQNVYPQAFARADGDTLYRNAIGSTNYLQAGQWHHMAAVYDRYDGKLRNYLNGILIAEADISSIGSITPTWLNIGNWGFGNSIKTDHSARNDDFRLYSRALGSNEVAELAADSSGPTAPVIISHPQSQTVAVGVTTTFGVAVSGTAPFAYTWRKDGSVIPGATNAVLLLTDVQQANAGSYSVIVGNVMGTNTSSNAVLTVNSTIALPVLSSIPASLSRDVGQMATLSVAASGTPPLSYQWMRNGSDLTVGAVLTNVTSTNLFISTVSTNDAGAYTVVVSNSGGSVTSTPPAVLTVNRLPQTITFGALPSKTVGDGAFNLSATNSAGLPVTFTSSTPGVATVSSNIVTIVGSGTTIITAAQPGNAIYLAAPSVSQPLVVNAGATAPTITVPPANLTLGTGQSGSFSVIANGMAPLSYQWQRNGTNLAVGGSITNVTAPVLFLNGVTTNDAGLYRVNVSNSLGSTNSLAATLSVTNNPVVSRTLRALDCAGAPGSLVTAAIELGAQGDENALSFSLQFDAALLTYSQTALGSNALGRNLTLNTNQLSQGRLGVVVSHASDTDTFGTGSRQVLLVSWQTAVNAPVTNTSVTFGDSPQARQIASVDAAPLAANYVSGQITLAGIEGDVGPRPNGDQVLDALDVTQLLRYLAGRDTNDLNVAFPRADVGPRGTKGDGVLDALDITQLLRYLGGRDPIVSVGGPARVGAEVPAEFPGTVRTGGRVTAGLVPAAASPLVVGTVSGTAGGSVVVPVTLGAQGIENSVTFSVAFPTDQLTYTAVALGAGAVGRNLTVNTNQLSSGRVGVVVSHADADQNFGTGTKELVRLSFTIAASASETAGLQLGSQPTSLQIADTNASPVVVAKTDGAVVIGPPPVPGAIQFAQAATSVSESATQVALVVTRTGGSTGIVGATVSTANVTAQSGADYLGITNTIAWADGETTSKTVQIALLGDILHEGDEVFTATLSAPTGGATLGSIVVNSVTILEDDPRPNTPPTVQITAPTNNAAFLAPANVTVTATASDTDGGTITKVEFMLDNVKQGEVLATPFTFMFTNVLAGTHSITARAIDNGGAVGSANVAITATNAPITGLQLSASRMSGLRNTEVLVPVTAHGFSNVGSMQFSMHWDPAIAQFVRVEQFGLVGLGATSFGDTAASSGVLRVSWEDGTGTNLPPGSVLFAIRFSLTGANGASTTISFDGVPTPIEFLTPLAQPIQPTFVAGQATILSTVIIGATVTYHATGTPVPGVVLTAVAGTDSTVTTDASGVGALVVNAGGDYAVTATRTNENPVTQGVTTADILAARRHILGVETLTSNALLAADADGSGLLTTGDLLHLRRLILGFNTTLPGGLWRFIPATASFTNLSVNTNVTFVAIKMGDVNGSWTPTLASQAVRNKTTTAVVPTVTFAVSTESALAGSAVKVLVRANGFTDVTTAQFSIAWDANVLSYVAVGDYGLGGLTSANFGVSQTGAGKLGFSWDDSGGTGVTLADGSTIFSISFIASQVLGSSAIVFASLPVPPEVTVSASTADIATVNGQVIILEPSSPLIVTQPRGQVVVRGAGDPSVVFGVVATNVTSYQWLLNGIPIGGANSAFYVLPEARRAHSGNYSVQVSGPGGTTVSSNALLRVFAPQRFDRPPRRLANGRIELTFGDYDDGPIGTNDLATLEVWGATSISGGDWVRITNGISIVNGRVQVEDADSPNLPRRFYRVFER